MGDIAQQINVMHQRMRTLYQSAGPPMDQPLIVQQAFEEMASMWDLLRAMQHELNSVQAATQENLAIIDAERQRYRELFDGAPDGYLVTGLDGTIRQANRAATKLLGAPAKELVGRSLTLFIPDGERRTFRTQIKQLQAHEHLHRWEISLRSWNGTSFEAELVARIVGGSNGKPQHIRWRLSDITERKRAEQALEQRIVDMEERLLHHEQTLHSWTFQDGVGHPREQAPARHWEDVVLKRAKELYAILAESCTLLAVASDDAIFGHIAHMIVPQIADICVIDIAETGGAVRQLVVVQTTTEAEQVREFQCRYWTSPLQMQERSCQPNFLPGKQSHDRMLQSILRQMEISSMQVAPIQVGDQLLGALTVASTSRRSDLGLLETSLFQELAQRMGAILLRTQAVGL